MNRAVYGFGRQFGRFAAFQCIRHRTLHVERVPGSGPVLLAGTHLSHLEPIIISCVLSRPVHWMSRKEFWANRFGAWFMRANGTFIVDRQRPRHSTLRRGMELLDDGRVVGVFPEGGVARGEQSVLQGGPIKRGVCVLSYRTGVPIVPVVVLGSHKLNTISPWIPPRRGRLWIAFGEPLQPPLHMPRRAARFEMSGRLSEAFVALYRELVDTTDADESNA